MRQKMLLVLGLVCAASEAANACDIGPACPQVGTIVVIDDPHFTWREFELAQSVSTLTDIDPMGRHQIPRDDPIVEDVIIITPDPVPIGPAGEAAIGNDLGVAGIGNGHATRGEDVGSPEVSNDAAEQVAIQIVRLQASVSDFRSIEVRMDGLVRILEGRMNSLSQTQRANDARIVALESLKASFEFDIADSMRDTQLDLAAETQDQIRDLFGRDSSRAEQIIDALQAANTGMEALNEIARADMLLYEATVTADDEIARLQVENQAIQNELTKRESQLGLFEMARQAAIAAAIAAEERLDRLQNPDDGQ